MIRIRALCGNQPVSDVCFQVEIGAIHFSNWYAISTFKTGEAGVIELSCNQIEDQMTQTQQLFPMDFNGSVEEIEKRVAIELIDVNKFDSDIYENLRFCSNHSSKDFSNLDVINYYKSCSNNLYQMPRFEAEVEFPADLTLELQRSEQ